MSLLQVRCPECKELIPVDDSRSKVFCMYCGAAILFSELYTEGANRLDGVFDPGSVTISAPAGRGCPIPVFVDGRKALVVNRGEVKVLDIEPGKHSIWVKVGMEGCVKSEFDVVPGDRFQIEQHGFSGYSVSRL